MNRNDKVVCSYHPDAILVEDIHAGDLVCSECGLVVADRVIDVGSEWRSFNDDNGSKDNSRVGQAEDELYGNELGTTIENIEGGAFNYKKVSSSVKYRNEGFKEIKHICSLLNIGDNGILEKLAMETFKELIDAKVSRKKGLSVLGAACIYYACKKSSHPRTIKEINQVSKASMKDIQKGYKLIVLNLQKTVNVTTPREYLERHCSQLALPRHIENAAKYISEQLKNIDELRGRSPLTLAAATIYITVLAGGIDKKLSEIAAVTAVAEATIKISYKLMLPHATKLFPENFNFVVPVERLPSS